jgi:hypothetical protein
MQVPLLSGVYADSAGDFRTRLPRNYVAVPKSLGLATGYLRPGDGIALFGTGPGVDRGGFNWNGVCYRVMGTKLVRVDEDGAITTLGDVGGSTQVTIDQGFDRIAIWSGGHLFYWDGTALTVVTDPDLGTVIDGRWIAGYFASTDGTNIIVTELNDPTSVNPLKYGPAESDPDPILAVDELRNELYALGRYTIEVFDNVGGDNFPFSVIEGAQVARGIIGTHAYAPFAETFAFVGGARNEPPSVWLMGAGTSSKIATREVDQILQQYTETELAAIVVETRTDKGHEQLKIHLPDQCLVFDSEATKALGEPVWETLDSGLETPSTYRARNLVWCYDKWIIGDPTSSALGTFDRAVSTHFGQTIGWDFGTTILYNDGNDAIVHELELVALPGRVALGADPTIWTSYSLDGETWSQERPISAGKQGERMKRLAWRGQGTIGQYRMQRFRGTSDAHVACARLEIQVEPLMTRPGYGR